MKQQHLFDGSARSRCPLAAATRRSRVGVSRHVVDGTVETIARAPAQDAHLVIVQLARQPAHDFWADGNHQAVPDSCAGTLSILDLNRTSQARFLAGVDSLHVHVPRMALDDLAVDARSRPVEAMIVPGRWGVADDVARQISALLVPTLDRPDEASQVYVDHLVLALTSYVASTYGGLRPHSISTGGLAPWQVRRATEMLAADLAGETPLHNIAEACGLSVSYFSRAFRVSTGSSPHLWLQRRRIDHAETLLLNASLSLAQVALGSGFADQSHMTRVFKKALGVTPGVRRRLIGTISS
jgi:AraC family transcriptional regulator